MRLGAGRRGRDGRLGCGRRLTDDGLGVGDVRGANLGGRLEQLVEWRERGEVVGQR